VKEFAYMDQKKVVNSLGGDELSQTDFTDNSDRLILGSLFKNRNSHVGSYQQWADIRGAAGGAEYNPSLYLRNHENTAKDDSQSVGES
jgi:predicted choloylglycine hydrolase